MTNSPIALTPVSYSVRDVERLLGVAHATLYKEISAGRLRTYTIGKRRMVSVAALRDYIEARERESGGSSPRAA